MNKPVLIDELHGKKVILFGAGYNGVVTLKKLADKGISVAFFCDNDPQKWGEHIEGTEIISCSELERLDKSEELAIVITPSNLHNAQKIKEALANLRTDIVFRASVLDILDENISVDYKHEIEYWENELSLNGENSNLILNRSQENRYSNICLPIFNKYLNIVNDKKKIPIVLDCGCGPFSALVYGHSLKKYILVCTDVLADEYSTMRKKYNFLIDYGMFNVTGEELSHYFGNDVFDIIWMDNALDHTASPKIVLEQMSLTLKQGGYLILRGFTFEGFCANYEGLHKHDIYIGEGDTLVCKSYNTASVKTFNLIDGLPFELVECELGTHRNGRDVFSVCYSRL